ncbi:MAG: enoyl-CoA hydratase/isomerase family protein [Acidimicrobiales bacterium]
MATIKFEKVSKPPEEFIDHHTSLGLALEKVRFDDSIRVVIITGRDDGLFELGPMREETEPWALDVLNPTTRPGGPGSLRGPWSLSQGIERTFATLALMEKPVIGRLNGDAYGFALHAMWGCDIIIAREDVLVSDNHLSMHPVLPFGMAAGDGAFAFLPLFMTPTKMKEFLMLGPRWTAKQMAELGLINYAVPADELDAKVDEFVQAFLARPPLALIRTKRAANKRLIEQMNLTLDYSWMAESIDHWEGSATGFEQQMTLRPDEPAWTVGDPKADPQGEG